MPCQRKNRWILTYRTGVVIATASELVFPRLPDMHKMFMKLLRGRVQDLLVINCQSGMGGGYHWNVAQGNVESE